MKQIVKLMLAIVLMTIGSNRICAEDNVSLLINDDLTFVPGEEKDINVHLKSTVELTSMQCFVSLPEGFTFTTKYDEDMEEDMYATIANSTIMHKTHGIQSRVGESGNLGVVIISMSNKSFKANEGLLFTFHVKAPETIANGEYTMKLTNVELIETEGLVSHKPTDLEKKIKVQKPLQKYSFTLNNALGGSATVSPSSTDNQYDEGTQLTLTASAGEGYEFVSWSNGVTDNPYTFAINAKTEISPVFAAKTYKVSYYDGETLLASFDVKYNEPIPGYTYEKEGYVFNGWDGESYSTMPAKDLIYTAILSLPKFYVSTNCNEGGYISLTPSAYDNKYEAGTNITATAVPYTGYEFVSWADGRTEDTFSFVVESDVNITATFAPKTYKVSYYDGETLLASFDVKYNEPIPSYTYEKEGYVFNGWDGESYSTMPAKDLVYTAILSLPVCYVSAYCNEGGYITLSPSAYNNKYEIGTTITATAVPDEGYEFVAWADGRTENTFSFVVESDIDITAIFAPKTYKVSYYDGETLLASFDVKFNDPIPDYTYEKKGYIFKGWDGESYSTMPAKDIVYTAILEEEVVDAISSLTSDATVTVHSVSGVCFKSNATAADIKALPAGLYIINGKKVYVK